MMSDPGKSNGYRVDRSEALRLAREAAVLLCLGTVGLLFSKAYAQKGKQACPIVVQPGAPGQPSRRLPDSTRPAAPLLSQADVAFMQGMIMHHSQAVEMTEMIALRSDNQEVRRLGAKIKSSQMDEMSFMKRWLFMRGAPTSMGMSGMGDMDVSGPPVAAMPGMLTLQQMEVLRKAKGVDFDRLFLAGMIQHHNGALVMVKDLFETSGAGQDADLFNFATDADNTQRAEIRIMQGMLDRMEQ